MKRAGVVEKLGKSLTKGAFSSYLGLPYVPLLAGQSRFLRPCPAFFIENPAFCFSQTERFLPNLLTFQLISLQKRDAEMRL